MHHHVLITREFLSSDAVTRAIGDLALAFDRFELFFEEKQVYLDCQVPELPEPDSFQDCLLNVRVTGVLPESLAMRACGEALIALAEPTFDTTERVLEAEFAGESEDERFELGPVKERNATEDTPQHALERFLTKLENASRPTQKRSWSVMQRSYDPTGAAAQAVYRAVVAARLPAASYELDLTLRPTLPHGIEAIRKLPGGEKEGECCLAEARLGNNTVSIVLRPTPAGHRLLVAGTHALDAQRLSQALGVELIPR